MDHAILGIEGFGPPQAHWAMPEQGRCLYLPRFDARSSPVPRPARGFGVQVYQLPVAGGRPYFVGFTFTEMLPRPENRVTLDPVRRDAWGFQCCT